jgi:hypothetical protein
MFALQYDEEGNWLDSPILVESVGTHDGPEYAEDEQAYQALMSSLEGLCEYRDTLQKLGGINQHYAVEAYELIPGWEEKTPKAYYFLGGAEATLGPFAPCDPPCILSAAWSTCAG